MLPDPSTPHQTQDRRLVPLRWLEAELEGYGLAAQVVPDMGGPYVFTTLPRTHGMRVRVDRVEEEYRYLWRDGAHHPINDPYGAARRIATRLRGERRDRERPGL